MKMNGKADDTPPPDTSARPEQQDGQPAQAREFANRRREKAASEFRGPSMFDPRETMAKNLPQEKETAKALPGCCGGTDAGAQARASADTCSVLDWVQKIHCEAVRLQKSVASTFAVHTMPQLNRQVPRGFSQGPDDKHAVAMDGTPSQPA